MSPLATTPAVAAPVPTLSGPTNAAEPDSRRPLAELCLELGISAAGLRSRVAAHHLRASTPAARLRHSRPRCRSADVLAPFPFVVWGVAELVRAKCRHRQPQMPSPLFPTLEPCQESP